MRNGLPTHKPCKRQREYDVLMGMVDLYIEEGKPVGSNTLKEHGFSFLSAATIRNYFARLEMEGYLKQHHTSGGRIPTDKAFQAYARNKLTHKTVAKEDDLFLKTLLLKETKEISLYFYEAIQALAEVSGCAVFISAPRFDQDFIADIKLLRLDEKRILCVMVTEFTVVHTEILYIPKELSDLSLQAVEAFFRYRLQGGDRPKLSEEVDQFLNQSYNELILRHFVSYTNMQHDDIYRGGFAKLLLHHEFHDPVILSNTLSLFEHSKSMSYILEECLKGEEIRFWIGDDLHGLIPPPFPSMIAALPYTIHNKNVGAIALLGPSRISYGKIFGLLERFAFYLSQNLTGSTSTYKLSYRTPDSKAIDVKQTGAKAIDFK